MWGVVLATYDRGYEQGDLLQNFHDDEGLRVRRRRIGETSALLRTLVDSGVKLVTDMHPSTRSF